MTVSSMEVLTGPVLKLQKQCYKNAPVNRNVIDIDQRIKYKY